MAISVAEWGDGLEISGQQTKAGAEMRGSGTAACGAVLGDHGVKRLTVNLIRRVYIMS